jgi:hypothetical protein
MGTYLVNEDEEFQGGDHQIIENPIYRPSAGPSVPPMWSL